MTTTPATQAILPVTVEQVDRDAAIGLWLDVACTGLMKPGEDKADFSHRIFAEHLALHRQAHYLPGDVGIRENDKPPAHWTPDDRYADRQPQTPEEWDWRADGPDNGALSRSIKRLNYGADRADPHAPDQMATVLRIDVMRVTSQLVWLTAKTEMYGKILAERNALRAALTPSAPEPVQKLHQLPEGEHICRHCEGKDPHCSVCEGVGSLPSALSGDAGEVLPADVARLVIAARTIAFNDWDGDSADWETARRELDAASEAFASRVPWENE